MAEKSCIDLWAFYYLLMGEICLGEGLSPFNSDKAGNVKKKKDVKWYHQPLWLNI